MNQSISSRQALGIIIALFMLGVAHAVAGQVLTNKITSPATAPVITATASAERLRFTAPGSVVQMQLQIYAESGQLLFDVTSRGNVLDWTLQDRGGDHLVPGSYLCVVTVKSLSGKLTQRIGSALVQEKHVGLQRAEPTQLTLAQQQAVGPIEENGALAILDADEAQATTVLANNGTEGQMIRGRGALTFRLGNFFSGIDREQMRLTEEGNLGIGTSEPQSKLDVAGTIRAERFLVAKPKTGSDKTTPDAQAADSGNSVQPLTSGAGNTGQLTKWTDGGNGVLGDSIVTESGGNVGIGTTGPGFLLDAQTNSGSNATVAVSSTLGLPPANVGFLASVDSSNRGRYDFFWNNGGGGLALRNGSNTAGNILFFTNSSGTNGLGNETEKVRIDKAGNVGIGTTAPGFLLDARTNSAGNGTIAVSSTLGSPPDSIGFLASVDSANRGRYDFSWHSGAGGLAIRNGSNAAGNIQFFTNSSGTNGLGNETEKVRIDKSGNVGIGTNNPQSLLDVNGNINTSTQYNIGGNRVLSNGGIRNLFAGVGAGQNNIGGDNAFFGNQSGLSSTVGFGNSFFGTVAGTSSTGNLNSFFGRGTGIQTSGQTNSFFGADAGLANTSGSNNTLIGYTADVGANNLTNATAIGANAKVSQSNSLVLGSVNGVNGASADTNVGIGTSAPVNVLHLNGNHNDFALTFTNQSNTSGRRGYRIAFDSDRLTFQSAADSGAFAANQMTIDPPTGNVGIGTTAPSFKLHINDPSNTGLRVQNNTSGGTVAGFGGFGAFQIDTTTTTGGRFTVKENGNTGIGTNNPNAKLQVVGGNVYIANPNSLIITSPNGTCWLVTVSNAGGLSSIAVPCP